MRSYLGKDWRAFRENRDESVVWDAASVQNGHTLFVGRSGSGKTTQLKRFLTGLQERSEGVRFHVFDVHDDIDLPNASEVMFSELTPYGLNPLRVGANPHFGGVRKCIQAFLRTVSKATGTLGVRQEAVLRKILMDVYRQRGFDAERPETWLVDAEAHLVSDGSDGRLYLDVPFSEKDQARDLGAMWDRDIQIPGRKGLWWVKADAYNGAITRWPLMTVGKMHPTLDDVLHYAKRLLKISFLGSDQEALEALESFQRSVNAVRKRELESLRAGRERPDDRESEGSPLNRAKDKALHAYANFLAKQRTGDELEDLIKYDSVEQLKSVVDRLETLKATGLFKSSEPPFDPSAAVWTYKLNALSNPEKRLFVLFRLQELFYAAVERGQQRQIRDVLVLDEVHLYVDESGDDILSTLSRESRKFGVAIIAANQTTQLPEAFITSLATKVVLGIDRLYWQQACSKMGMTPELLHWIAPKSTMAIQMQDSSKSSGEWRGVLLRRPAAAAPAPPTQQRVA